MANILEYTLSLQDQVSAKLQKIGINNDMMLDKFAKLEKQAKDVSTTFLNMGSSVHSLQKKVELLKAERDLLPIGSLSSIRKYNSEINSLEGKITKLQTLNGSKVKTWFKDALNGLPGIATNPLVLIGAGIGSSIKKGMEADMQKANILTLVKGNADKAKALYQDITKYGIKTPYEKEDIIESQKTMMSFGLNSEFAFGKLKQIGDIALGDAQKMQSLSLAFSQATSAGKLQGQDLLQMINAGFNPLQVISERTGESMASLKERMSKGGISANEMAKAFEWATDSQGQFFNGAERASKTMGGKWSNMMDALSEMMLQIYELVSPVVMPLIEGMTSALSGITNGISQFINEIKQGNPIVTTIAVLVGAFTTALILHNTYTWIASGLQDKLTFSIIKTNLAFLASPITWIITGVILLIGAITWLILKVDGWGKAWEHTMNFAKLTFKLFVDAIKLYFNTYIDTFMVGLNYIKKGWYEFKNLIGAGDEAENNSAIAKINADTQQRKQALIDGAKKLKETALKAGNEFSAIGGSLKFNQKSFGDVASEIGAKIGITTPGTIPGAATTNTDSNTTNTVVDTTTKTNNAIATGGTKHNYYNIVIKEMNGLKANTVTASKEAIDKTTAGLEDAVLRVLAMSATTAG